MWVRRVEVRGAVVGGGVGVVLEGPPGGKVADAMVVLVVLSCWVDGGCCIWGCGGC